MSSILKSTKAASKEFAKQTTLSGFNEILHSKHWLESIFWAVLIAVGFILTVRDCEAPIRAYLEEATVSIVELRRNDTISFPDASICVEVQLDLLTPKNATRLTDVASFEAFQGCLLSPECHRHVKFYDEFYDEIAATTKLLASYVVGEHGRENQIVLTNRVASLVPDSFHRLLISTNIPTTALVEIVAFALCSKMEFKMELRFGGRNQQSIDFCSSSTLSWFGVPPLTLEEVEHLCYVNSNFTTFTLTGNSRQVKNTVSFLPSIVYYPEVDDSFYSDHSVYVSLNYNRLVIDQSVNVVWFKDTGCHVMYVEVLTHIRSIDKRRSPCSRDDTVNGCVRQCHASTLKAYCNCTSVSCCSLSSNQSPSLGQSCFALMERANFTKCAYAARHRDPNEACEARCKRENERCEAKTIRVEKNQLACESEDRANSTTIEIVVNHFQYLYCEEVFSMELSQLMSNLGGVVGLWLGVGFIGLVHAIIFPLKLFTDRFDVEKSTLSELPMGEVAALALKLADIEKANEETHAQYEASMSSMKAQLERLQGEMNYCKLSLKHDVMSGR